MPKKVLSRKKAVPSFDDSVPAGLVSDEIPGTDAGMAVCPNCQSFDISGTPEIVGGMKADKFLCNECGNEFYSAPEIDAHPVPKARKAKKKK